MPGASSLRDCKILENIIRKQAADGRLYAAICASPAVALGSWDLLKGVKVSFLFGVPFSSICTKILVICTIMQSCECYLTGDMLSIIHGAIIIFCISSCRI